MANTIPGLTAGADALANLILVTPQIDTGMQPQPRAYKTGERPTLPRGLLFSIKGEERVTIQSDITDHFVEDNTVFNNQIALRPEEYTVSGYIGELADITPEPLQALRDVADKLLPLTAYTPLLTTTAQLAYNRAAFLYALGLKAADAAVQAWESVGGERPPNTSFIDSGGLYVGRNQNKQQVMFQQLYGYWRNRILFTVQTPWAIFQNMAIKSITPIQSEETRMITNFDITFKMIRIADQSQGVGRTTVSDCQGRAAFQASPVTDFGVGETTPTELGVMDIIPGLA